MTTEGRGVIGQIQKDLREAQVKLKNLEDLPRGLGSLNERVNKIEALDKPVKDLVAEVEVLTKKIGKGEGGPAKKGADWKPIAIVILAAAFIAMLVMLFNQNSQIQANQQQTLKLINNVDSSIQATVKSVNDALSSSTATMNKAIGDINAKISELRR